jgi:hypothetical protein
MIKMSMYNMLFGTNPIAPVLKQVLRLDVEGGYDTGRFRDIYIENDKIILYTRNGGGNRECYQDIIDLLAEHPNYITDYDDDFDCTYAYIEFSIPDEFKEFCKELEQYQGDTSKVSDKFKKYIDIMNKRNIL